MSPQEPKKESSDKWITWITTGCTVISTVVAVQGKTTGLIVFALLVIGVVAVFALFGPARFFKFIAWVELKNRLYPRWIAGGILLSVIIAISLWKFMPRDQPQKAPKLPPGTYLLIADFQKDVTSFQGSLYTELDQQNECDTVIISGFNTQIRYSERLVSDQQLDSVINLYSRFSGGIVYGEYDGQEDILNCFFYCKNLDKDSIYLELEDEDWLVSIPEKVPFSVRPQAEFIACFVLGIIDHSRGDYQKSIQRMSCVLDRYGGDTTKDIVQIAHAIQALNLVVLDDPEKALEHLSFLEEKIARRYKKKKVLTKPPIDFTKAEPIATTTKKRPKQLVATGGEELKVEAQDTGNTAKQVIIADTVATEVSSILDSATSIEIPENPGYKKIYDPSFLQDVRQVVFAYQASEPVPDSLTEVAELMDDLASGENFYKISLFGIDYRLCFWIGIREHWKRSLGSTSPDLLFTRAKKRYEGKDSRVLKVLREWLRLSSDGPGYRMNEDHNSPKLDGMKPSLKKLDLLFQKAEQEYESGRIQQSIATCKQILEIEIPAERFANKKLYKPLLPGKSKSIHSIKIEGVKSKCESLKEKIEMIFNLPPYTKRYEPLKN